MLENSNEYKILVPNITRKTFNWFSITNLPHLIGGDSLMIKGNTEEDTYWRNNYHTTTYYSQGYDYDTDYRSAYDYGYRARHHFNTANDFESVEDNLRTDWEQFKGSSRLTWDQARLAARDAWYRIKR